MIAAIEFELCLGFIKIIFAPLKIVMEIIVLADSKISFVLVTTCMHYFNHVSIAELLVKALKYVLYVNCIRSAILLKQQYATNIFTECAD